LVARHQTAMLRVARFYVPSAATAEDVVQETWMAVLRGIDSFAGRSSIKTWMFHILINRAKTAGQREGRTILFAEMAGMELSQREPSVSAERFLESSHPSAPHHWKVPPLPFGAAADSHLAANEGARLVYAAINELPAAQRLVISLRDVESWDAREVCNVLGLTETNQRVLLHRARSKVRASLEAYFGESSEG